MSEISLKSTCEHAPRTVSVERPSRGGRDTLVVRTGDRSHEIEIQNSPSSLGWVRIGGNIRDFIAVRRKSAIHVWIAGRIYFFEIVDGSRGRARETASQAAPSDLMAPMPGTILRINVAVGDRFDPHDPLMIMESMKMEMTLSMPYRGRVREVLVRAGQLVEMNAMLARLEPLPDGSGPSGSSSV